MALINDNTQSLTTILHALGYHAERADNGRKHIIGKCKIVFTGRAGDVWDWLRESGQIVDAPEPAPETDDRERGPWPWTLETLTNADATAEAERHAAQERKREQREELQRRAAAPLTARHAAHLAQGVLFAMDESLFSGRSAERAIA